MSINHGLAVFHVTKEGADVIDAPVYLFKASGSYLGKYERTDAVGEAEFLLPDQQYKFRVDRDGTQYWSDEVAIIPQEENNIQLNLDLLALDLTNNPNPVRFDGVPPQYKPEKVMVASLYDLTGLLVQSVVSQMPAETVYYYINNHLGTPHKMIDENGEVVWSSDYRPFGDADVDPVSTATNSFRFPGQYYDQETGLCYNWHRYYDPIIGRYLTPDPIGLVGGINIYVYAHNNTFVFVDPRGLIKWGVVGKGFLSALGGATSVATGAGLASTPTGVGQVVGTVLVLGGSSAFSYGVSQIIVGFLDEEIPFMETKEAIIRGTTTGLTQENLLNINELINILPDIASGRLNIPSSRIGEVMAYVQYSLKIGKSAEEITKDLEEAGLLGVNEPIEAQECK